MAGRGRRPVAAAAEEFDAPAGQENRPARRRAKPQDDPEQIARTIVLRQLTLQPRTKAELERTLHRRGVSDEVIDQVLGRCAEVGLIDDAAFAQAWVETRHTGRGLARRALAQELRRKGVDSEEIDIAVEQLTPDTELATARTLVARKLPSTRTLPPRVRVRRLLNLLARKGYPSNVALQVVREALAGQEEDLQWLEGLDEAFEAAPTEDSP